jgi:hypothetical protein
MRAYRRRRVAWGKAICQQLERHFNITDEHRHPDQPIYFLTLVDLACCTSQDVKSVNLNFVAAQLRHGLKRLSYKASKVRKMKEDQLGYVTTEYDLDVDIDKISTLKRKAKAVLDALAALGLLKQ